MTAFSTGDDDADDEADDADDDDDADDVDDDDDDDVDGDDDNQRRITPGSGLTCHCSLSLTNDSSHFRR